ncbi:ClpP/crotonase [Aureobasidium subglaciale]|nr:ClpP/crotonase [Aureobasidium subglaciale]
MKILLLCTAHNSLSQRLYLTLVPNHEITIEYALSAETMIEAVRMAHPHLVICPFLTSAVPTEIYTRYMTLVVHPGAPGDGGPSALDFIIMGEDGTDDNLERVMSKDIWSEHGRTHWAVTVLQAIAEYDAGPVWAFEQFRLDIDDHHLTKSSLYRGDVTRAAVSATLAALDRVQLAFQEQVTRIIGDTDDWSRAASKLEANAEYKTASVTTSERFHGGHTAPLPFLKAAQRDFDISRHSARMISRLIRASDSQPGCLTKFFGPSLYIYGGFVEDGQHMSNISVKPGRIIGTRNDGVCFKTVDNKGIWITHARRVKKRTDASLWPKAPAVLLFAELGIIDLEKLPQFLPSLPADFSRVEYSTFQEISVEFEYIATGQRVAYLTFDFYNGAMIVLLGGSYFSNGIHLNVIEAASDPAYESWTNINAMDDVVLLLLQDFSAHNITTISTLRGNAAAGGVALAAAADYVIAGDNVVINPAYRALGLFGSEYHTLTYPGRVGHNAARHLIRDMLPISAQQAKDIGLVDVVLPGHGTSLDEAIHTHVSAIISTRLSLGIWKRALDLSPLTLATTRMLELAEMAKDFWSPRSLRYHFRRRDFARKIKPSKTPLRFAQHRRKIGELDEEERDDFDLVETFEVMSKKAQEQALWEGTGALGMQARKASHPSIVAKKEKGKLEMMFACYYSS